MSPRKQPESLLGLAIKVTIITINRACDKIFDEYRCPFPGIEHSLCKEKMDVLREYLYTRLPASIFDILCAERRFHSLEANPIFQLSALFHPSLTCFLKCDMDNKIPHHFWVDSLAALTRLRILDLKLICTDEILKVIGENCPDLEEMNAISRVDLRKSPFNASVLIRNVSDDGLTHLFGMKRLRILAIDPPRNERLNLRVGRCISQAGILQIAINLPSLEEIRVESCDVGSILIASPGNCQPLTLKKINFHFVCTNSIARLLTLCPSVCDLSLTHSSRFSHDEILQQVSESDVRLNRLDLSFFGFSDYTRQLLSIKGNHITNLSILETNESMDFDAVLTIGKCCPNISKFRLITQSDRLGMPDNFKIHSFSVFNTLRSLTLGCDNRVVESLLFFFLSHSTCVSRLSVRYQTRASVNETLTKLLSKGLLNNIVYLCLDYTQIVSNDIIKLIIDKCEHLNNLVLNYCDFDGSLHAFIHGNNYDLNLDNFY